MTPTVSPYSFTTPTAGRPVSAWTAKAAAAVAHHGTNGSGTAAAARSRSSAPRSTAGSSSISTRSTAPASPRPSVEIAANPPGGSRPPRSARVTGASSDKYVPRGRMSSSAAISERSSTLCRTCRSGPATARSRVAASTACSRSSADSDCSALRCGQNVRVNARVSASSRGRAGSTSRTATDSGRATAAATPLGRDTAAPFGSTSPNKITPASPPVAKTPAAAGWPASTNFPPTTTLTTKYVRLMIRFQNKIAESSRSGRSSNCNAAAPPGPRVLRPRRSSGERKKSAVSLPEKNALPPTSAAIAVAPGTQMESGGTYAFPPPSVTPNSLTAGINIAAVANPYAAVTASRQLSGSPSR